MDTLKLNRKIGKYGNKQYELTVKNGHFNKSHLYESYLHEHKEPLIVHVIKIEFNTVTTQFFPGNEFVTNKVRRFEVFFARECPNNPLAIGICTIDNNTNYYGCRELLSRPITQLIYETPYNSSGLLYLLDYENKKVNTKVFCISEENGYSDVEVKSGNLDENFKNYTHSTTEKFSFLKINCTLKCDFNGYNESAHRSSTLQNLCVYYHSNDTNKYYPLMLEFRPKHNHSHIYYQLSAIDSKLMFERIYNSTSSDYVNITSNLNSTYLRLKDQMTPYPNLSLFATQELEASTYIPPRKEDLSDAPNHFATLGWLFLFFFIGLAISFIIYKLYFRLKYKRM